MATVDQMWDRRTLHTLSFVDLQAELHRTTTVMIEMAERIGRDGINEADLASYVQLLEDAEQLRTRLDALAGFSRRDQHEFIPR